MSCAVLPPLLVGAKLAVETGRRGDRFDRGVQGVVEERGQPGDGGGIDADDVDVLPDPELVEAHPGAEQVAGGRRACRSDGRQEGADADRVELHPLTP